MVRFAVVGVLLLVLTGCGGATQRQLKQAPYDCRDRNFDVPEAIPACDLLLARYQSPSQRAIYLAARGTAYGRDGRTEEAIAELSAALDLDPGLTNARLERAKLLEKLGDQPGPGRTTIRCWPKDRGSSMA